MNFVCWLNPNLRSDFLNRTACGKRAKGRKTTSRVEDLTCDICEAQAAAYYARRPFAVRG